METFVLHFRTFVEEQGGYISRDRQQGDAQVVSAVVPTQSETIQRGDPIQGGLLLRLTPAQAQLAGYVFRLVCRNGMVVPDFYLDQTFAPGDEEAFAQRLPSSLTSMQKRALPQARTRFQRALQRPADDWYQRMVLAELDHLRQDPHWLDRLRQAARQEADRWLPVQRVNRARWRRSDYAHLSRFDVINAVTALAQQEDDESTRLQMERLGWRLLAQEELPPTPGRRHRHRRTLVIN